MGFLVMCDKHNVIDYLYSTPSRLRSATLAYMMLNVFVTE